jgi:hypothetical protein
MFSMERDLLEGRRKDFFFEKKKQKTFANCVRQSAQMGVTDAGRNGKSFLFLFFKKEQLP